MAQQFCLGAVVMFAVEVVTALAGAPARVPLGMGVLGVTLLALALALDYLASYAEDRER